MKIKLTVVLQDTYKQYILSRDITSDCIPREGEWIEVRTGLISEVQKIRWTLDAEQDVIIKLLIIQCSDASHEEDTLKEGGWYEDTQSF